ncbi:MAG: hypothetical protein LIO86_09805 [Lachnospiraceae bacterium]|nr:hypothetical protein [Lachnospiraceae bacterium]
MKFKEIKPGMVIHCPKEEDAVALFNHLESLGYGWLSGCLLDDIGYTYWDVYSDKTGYRLSADKTDAVAEYGDVDSYQAKGLEITEFSDLIEPENSTQNSTGEEKSTKMSAVEVLEWLRDNYRDYNGELFRDVFGADYTVSELLVKSPLGPAEVVQKITAYEAAKKESKPVEVEWETQYTIKSRHPDLQNWEDRVIVIGYENAREMRENSERILKEHINSIVGGIKYPVSDYYVIPLRRCQIKGDK